MAKETVNTKLPLNNDGIVPGQESVLNQDHVEYDPIKIYSERAPYSKTSKVSEVFGPKIHSYVNMLITSYAKLFDSSLEKQDKESAGFFEGGIKKIYTQLQHLSNLKDEWMVMRGGGMRGKSTVSNITDPRFPDEFFTEKGSIHITPDFEIECHVPSLAGPPKLVNDISLDWESKGDGEGRYMAAVQDMQEARDRGDKSPPFNIDYFVSNLLKEFWPQALADDWHAGEYALQKILPEMIERNGGTMEGLDLSIEAFNPDNSLLLHNHYANNLRKAFSGEEEKETRKDEITSKTSPADRLMARLTSADELTHTTKSAIRKERKEHGRI